MYYKFDRLKAGFLFLMVTFFVLALGSYQVIAGTTKGENYGSAVMSVDISESSRLQSTQTITANSSATVNDLAICQGADVTCNNFAPSDATVTVECVGLDSNSINGGWVIQNGSLNGACWRDLEVCYAQGTASEVCFDLAGDPATPSHLSLTPYSACTNPDPVKGICIEGTGFSSDTGDDMFRLDGGAGAFIEYTNVGGLTDSDRLRWLSTPVGARSMMVPSGPPGTYSDFRRFMASPNANVSIESACLPLQADFCSGVGPQVPPVAGVCGPADGASAGLYSSYADIPSSQFCTIGEPTNKNNGSAQITWNCLGRNGGSTSSECSIDTSVDGVCGSANSASMGTYATLASISAAAACDVGSMISATEAYNTLSWKCSGTGVGAYEPSCSTQTGNGLCGPADVAAPGTYETLASIPADQFCTIGTVANQNETDPNTITWNCEGVGNGTVSPQCNTAKDALEDGACGVADGGIYASLAAIPADDFCSGGDVAEQVDGNPITWSCYGVGGSVNNAGCSASVTVDAACGTAHNGLTETSPTANLCGEGATSTGVTSGTGSPYNPWVWQCVSGTGGASTSCKSQMTPGKCGPYNGRVFASKPTPTGSYDKNFCEIGTVSDLFENSPGSASWNWSCATDGGAISCTTKSGDYGECGSADGVSTTTKPTSGLCASGTSSSVSGSGPWNWSCVGADVTASCSAPLAVVENGTCGPSVNSCSSGTLSDTTDTATAHKWSCVGANGGTTADCSENKVLDLCWSIAGGNKSCTTYGACSTFGAERTSVKCEDANGNMQSGFTVWCQEVSDQECVSEPNKVNGVCGATQDSCTGGTFTDVADSATEYKWSCAGEYGGTTANCSVNKPVDGACGSYQYAPTCAGSCAKGSFVDLPTSGYTRNWSCEGLYNGSDTACSIKLTQQEQNDCEGVVAENGTCGTALDTCSEGVFSDVADSATDYLWSCKGTHGGTDANNCSLPKPVNGACGSAKDSCTDGVFSDVADSATDYLWSCKGEHGGTDANSCSLPKPVNASCGTALNSCNPGTLSDTADSSTHYQWACLGSNGGADANNCSLPKPVNGACGSAKDSCTDGVFSDVADSATDYLWSCKGEHGGTDANSCSLPKPVNASCGTALNSCNPGTLSDTADSSTHYNWNCIGASGGGSVACSLPKPVNGACGTTTNSCTSGTFFDTADTLTYYKWDCNGSNGGANKSCSLIKPVDGACGTTTNSCSKGTFSDVADTSTYYKWNCLGTDGGVSKSCQLAKPVNGVCGSADGTTVTQKPTSNLCAQGIATTVSGSGPWAWRCNGTDGGTTSGICEALAGLTLSEAQSVCPKSGSSTGNQCGWSETYVDVELYRGKYYCVTDSETETDADCGGGGSQSKTFEVKSILKSSSGSVSLGSRVFYSSTSSNNPNPNYCEQMSCTGL